MLRVVDTARRILITGGGGYIGSALAEKLINLDGIERVVSIDLHHDAVPDRPVVGNVSKSPDAGKLIRIESDVREPLGDVLSDHGIDTVIHLAFLLRTHRNEKFARSVNVDATAALLAESATSNIARFLYLSSTTVYGAHARNNRILTEADQPEPTPGFQYSQHKLEAENLVNEHATLYPETRTTILRACPVLSAGASNFISSSLGMRFLPVPRGHDPDLQFIHLNDLLDAIVTVIRSEHAAGIFNIAGQGSIKLTEMTRLTGARRVPVPRELLRPVIDLSWKFHIQNKSPVSGLDLITYPWIVSCEKACETIGWKSTFSSREAIESWASGRRSS